MPGVLDRFVTDREAEIVGLTHWLRRELSPAHLQMALRLAELRAAGGSDPYGSVGAEVAGHPADPELAKCLVDALAEAFPGFAPALRLVAADFLDRRGEPEGASSA